MADTVITAAPQVITHPYIRLGTSGSGWEFSADCTKIDCAVDQAETNVETFGGVYTGYKSEKWIITATVAMSYSSTAGVWGLLRPLCGTTVAFEVRPDTAVVGVTNPKMTGTAFIKGFPFLAAGPGDVSEVDIVCAVQGAPTFANA